MRKRLSERCKKGYGHSEKGELISSWKAWLQRFLSHAYTDTMLISPFFLLDSRWCLVWCILSSVLAEESCGWDGGGVSAHSSVLWAPTQPVADKTCEHGTKGDTGCVTSLFQRQQEQGLKFFNSQPGRGPLFDMLFSAVGCLKVTRITSCGLFGPSV